MYKLSLLFLSFFISSSLFAADFITRWDMNKPGGNPTEIIFGAGTTGPVSYTWETVPALFNGSGTFSGPTAIITGLPAGAIIRLHIDSTNFNRIVIHNGLDSLRLLEVEQWGNISWSSMEDAFLGCYFLDVTATDIPDLSQVSNLSYMFGSCKNLIGSTFMDSWNTSNVTDMSFMFWGATQFNQPILNWNTGNVTNMRCLFKNAYSFNQPIVSWNTGNVTNMVSMFENDTSFNQPIGNWNTGNVTRMDSMFKYATNFNQSLDNWNTVNVVNMGYMFSDATNFNQSIGNWNTGNVTLMDFMFYKATNFNQPIGNWNTSNVTNMSGMFWFSTMFDQPIGNWNTGNVILMDFMFSWATSFNQSIGNWNTGNVNNMDWMFEHATSFNQPIGNWNTGNVIQMEAIFSSAINFNQPIGNWNTGNVLNMSFMFENAINFNQPIGNWNTSNVNVMGYMFYGASSFNQPISNWNTGNVSNMGFMFAWATNFNQPIGNWNTSNVMYMHSMFLNATNFNQPLNNWNTSNVIFMYDMFKGAGNFNQPIGNWNTANVTYMWNMFNNATSFNQPIGNWVLHPNVNMNLLLNNCGMDCNTYTSTLYGWATNPLTPNGRNLGAQGRHYSSSVQADRAYLINTKGWTITGDALNIGFCCIPQSDTINQAACNSYFFNGLTLNSSGVYYDTLMSSNGCDSLVILNLTINSNSSTLNISTCNPYFFNGQTLTTSGTYYDTLMNANGCDSLVTLNLTINNVNTSVTQTGSTLTANTTGAAYQWLSCPSYSPILGETNQIFTATVNGDYAVEIIQNGCTDTSACYTVIGIGMNEMEHTSAFSVYPNPVHGKLVIRSSSAFAHKKKELYNSLGQLVFTTSPDSFPEIIDMSAYSKGIYYLKCENQVVKVVVK